MTFLVGGILDAQFPVVDDPERRIRPFLTAQGDPVDRERFETDGGKAIAQHHHDRFASLGGKPTRKCHVEAEVCHDIGVTPAVQMFALPRRQRGRISPRTIPRRKRRAQRIEFADAIGGKPLKCGRWFR